MSAPFAHTSSPLKSTSPSAASIKRRWILYSPRYSARITLTTISAAPVALSSWQGGPTGSLPCPQAAHPRAITIPRNLAIPGMSDRSVRPSWGPTYIFIDGNFRRSLSTGTSCWQKAPACSGSIQARMLPVPEAPLCPFLPSGPAGLAGAFFSISRATERHCDSTARQSFHGGMMPLYSRRSTSVRS